MLNLKVEHMGVLSGEGAVRMHCGFRMAQSYSALYMLEWFFKIRHDIKRIIEIGTGHGGMSVYLSMWAWSLGGTFETYDIKSYQKNEDLCHLLDSLTGTFVLGDVFEEPYKSSVIKSIQAPGAVLLFCDGGDKIKEVNAFAPYLKHRDCIMAHDYGDRPSFTSIDQLTPENAAILAPYLQEEFDAVNSHILSMRRTK